MVKAVGKADAMLTISSAL